MPLSPLRFDRNRISFLPKGSRRRPLGNKLQEIAGRSPKDLDAFDTIADLVLQRLNAEDAARQKA